MSNPKGKRNLITIALIAVCCCTLFNNQAQASSDVEISDHQPTHFETHEISDEKNDAETTGHQELATNLDHSKNENPTSINEERTTNNLADLTSAIVGSSSLPNSGNLPAADRLNPRFELPPPPPPPSFSNSRQSNGQTNALETALNGYGQVRKSPQYPSSETSPYNSIGSINVNAGAPQINYQRQPQMISVLSGGASLHQSVSWNPPNPPQSAFNGNSFTSPSARSSSGNQFQQNFNSPSANVANENFVPSMPPKVHETNDFASHDTHVNSRPHNSVSSNENSALSSSASRDPISPPSQAAVASNLQTEKTVSSPDASSQPATKPKPHTVVKNGDGKKDDVVIYYYYYYDDEKNKTSSSSGSSTAAPSLDVIPSLDQYDNVPIRKPTSTDTEASRSSSRPASSSNQPIVPVSNQPVNSKPAEFKLDGSAFKFDTTGFTPITSTTPASFNVLNNQNALRSQDRGVHVHNNPLYGNADQSTSPSTTTSTTTTTTTTSTTTEKPTTIAAKPSESPVADEKKPNYGRRRFGSNSIAPVVRSSSTSSNSAPSSSSASSTSGRGSSNSNSNLASSRSRSRLSTTTTTTTPRSRGSIRNTTPASAAVPAVTRASSSIQSPPRRGFFSSRNRNNGSEENKAKEETTNSSTASSASAASSVTTSTTPASNNGIRSKFGSGRRGFAPTSNRSRDSSAVASPSSTSAPARGFTTSTTSAPVVNNVSSSSTSSSSNSLSSSRLRGRPSFSRSNSRSTSRGVNARGSQASSSANKKDEPTSVTTSSDISDKKETTSSSIAGADSSHTSESPSSASGSSSSSGDKTESGSSASTESATTQQSTTVNPRARNNPLFRSRPRSNLFGNRG